MTRAASTVRRLRSLVVAYPVAGKMSVAAAHAGVAAVLAPRYVRDWVSYRRKLAAASDPGGGQLLSRVRLRDAYPCVTDRIVDNPFDPHYFHQSVWAAREIDRHGPAKHVDVGSLVLFVGMLAAVRPVEFVDIRPLDARIDGLTWAEGSLDRLPYPDGSVESLSCLHVIEHIGLGRYGDPLDPLGSFRSCRELARVLTPGGRLYLSTPVGVPRVCFNAHRIHDPEVVRSWMSDLDLESFAFVDDNGTLHTDAVPSEAAKLRYGCGMYVLVKQATKR